MASKPGNSVSFGNINIVKGNLNNLTSIQQKLIDFQPDAVIHLAAESHVDRSIDGPAEFINTNILGTYNLLEAAKDLWGTSAEGKKFLHVSTDEVFGSLNPKDKPFTEEHKYYPNSPYSASKASSDLLVRAWAITYGLPAIVSNCSNNYGPWQFPEKFIPVVIFNAIQGNEIPIYGDGGNIRDWLYVDDHVKALLKIVESGLGYTTFNIGANQEISNLKLAELICSLLDSMNPRKDSISYKEQISFVEDRLGHDFRYAINSEKLKNEMGFSIENIFDQNEPLLATNKSINKIPKEERPTFGTELKVAQIVIEPKVSDEEVQRVIDRLNEFKHQVEEEGKSFTSRAVLYTEDGGSKKTGGLYTLDRSKPRSRRASLTRPNLNCSTYRSPP